jgi:hypothetical protein
VPTSPQYTGHYAGLHGEDAPHVTTADVRAHLGTWQTQAEEEEEYDDVVSPRMASIVPRYNRIPTSDRYIEKRGNQHMHVHFVDTPPQIVRASRITEASEQQPRRLKKPRRRFHWMFWVGLVFFIMIVGYAGLSTFGSWWQIHSDDTTYGRPRTYQTDAVVGHGDSPRYPSHFIAMNQDIRHGY